MAALAVDAAAPDVVPAPIRAAQVNATGLPQHGRRLRSQYVYLIVMPMPKAGAVATHGVKTPSDT